MKKFIVILFILTCTFVNAQQRRVALIIGNQEYEGHFSPLHTTINDARAMDNVLQKLGFKTIKGEDVSRESMSKYLDKFRSEASGAEMALFYYSGHAGFDGTGRYYLAPSGKYNRQATLTTDCYPFDAIEKEIARISAPIKFLIIDACRNSIDDSKAKVAHISIDAIKKKLPITKGTIRWFATGVSKPAHTGYEEYSLFTKSILNHAGDFDDLNTVFKRISDEVTSVDKDQKPESDETSEHPSSKVYFNPQRVKLYNINKEGKDYYGITSTPSDATISINGKEHKSGDSIVLNYGRKYNVVVSAVGYRVHKDTITATPYKTNYHFPLYQYAKSKLNIQCDKKGAIAFLDGKRMGYTPIRNIETFEGPHDICIEKNGYRTYRDRPILDKGTQNVYVKLSREYPWFWKWDGDGLNIISYHYGNKYPIGLCYMYRPDDCRSSIGAIIAVSTGVFRGWRSPLTMEQDLTIIIGGEDEGNDPNIKKEVVTINGTKEHYSSFIDPNNEAKHNDLSALFLANYGYSPCNGITLEAGLGAGYHADLFYMDKTYTIRKTISTNIITGEVTESPYEYEQKAVSKWYRENKKWSPAIRLGAKFLIPIDSGPDTAISVGAGYTYLPILNKFSSWDANIGFCWCF